MTNKVYLIYPGYPIGVLIWVLIKINDQIAFCRFCQIGDVSLVC